MFKKLDKLGKKLESGKGRALLLVVDIYLCIIITLYVVAVFLEYYS